MAVRRRTLLRRSQFRRRQFQPHVELLEDRLLLALYVVNSVGDEPDTDLMDTFCDTDPITAGPQCTLRAAIEQANATAGADEIQFSIGAGGL